MSNYPIWWDTTVTIYNQFIDTQTSVVTWRRHVFNQCFWKQSGQTVKLGEVTIQTGGVTCRIPEQENFLQPYDWTTLPNDKMDSYFTLAPDDIVVRGEVDDTIDEYTKGHRASDFLTKYANQCFRIKTVAVNTGVGRNNPHYLITGE